MADDHITLRISKKLVALIAFGVLIPAAFVAGLAVSGGNSQSAPTTTVASTTTVAAITPETTTLAPTTTVKKSSTPTTVKKKPATTTTTPAPLSVTASYSDNCPAPGLPNAGVMGKMTITWTSTSAVRAKIQIQHGSQFGFTDDNETPSGSVTIDRPCNDAIGATGAKTGNPLTVIYRITAYSADGSEKMTGNSGTDSM